MITSEEQWGLNWTCSDEYTASGVVDEKLSAVSVEVPCREWTVKAQARIQALRETEH